MTWQDQFPDVSKIIKEQITLHSETFCIDELMDELYIYTMRQLQNHDKLDVGVEILNHSDFEKCRIFADRMCLRQILVLLLIHAVKSTESGCIFLGFQTVKTNRIKFYVEDMGDYIPENQLQQIFRQSKHNVQYDKHPELFVSRELIQLMGGKLNIKSSGTGAIFSFSFACNPCEIT